MPDVAIVMAARNEERFIGRAIRSCRAQSMPCEILVVDDASTDHTGEIALTSGTNQLLVNGEYLGLPASLNKGVRAARSKYIVRVDADDYVHHDFALILAHHLEMNPTWEAVACDYLTVDEHERPVARVSAMDTPIGCGIMFRKDRLVEIGLYNEDFLLGEDAELRSRFRWPVHHCQLPLYRYRRHPGSMTFQIAA